MYFEQADFDKCMETCLEAIARGREIFSPYALIAKGFQRIGNALYKKGDLAGAIKALEDAELEAHSVEFYDKLKKWRKEAKEREEQAYLDPGKANEAKERGNDLFKAGRFAEAVKEYSEAIRRDPTNAVYLGNRAAAKMKVMDFPGAVGDCEKAIKMDPKFVRGYTRLGQAQMALREYHKAMDTFKTALELDPANAEAEKGIRDTVSKINSSQSSKEDDPERAARAMQDPEIQALLVDPMVKQAIEDMQRNPESLRHVLADPGMAAKIQKLIAAGILRIG